MLFEQKILELKVCRIPYLADLFNLCPPPLAAAEAADSSSSSSVVVVAFLLEDILLLPPSSSSSSCGLGGVFASSLPPSSSSPCKERRKEEVGGGRHLSDYKVNNGVFSSALAEKERGMDASGEKNFSLEAILCAFLGPEWRWVLHSDVEGEGGEKGKIFNGASYHKQQVFPLLQDGLGNAMRGRGERRSIFVCSGSYPL